MRNAEINSIRLYGGYERCCGGARLEGIPSEIGIPEPRKRELLLEHEIPNCVELHAAADR